MSDTIYDRVDEYNKVLRLDINGEELAHLANNKGYTKEQLEAIDGFLCHMKEKKEQTVRTTLLRMSRLPMAEPKTFDGFDFSRIHGKNVDEIKQLKALTEVYARMNLAFIGPPGVGKTHISIALGRECCLQGMKTYFLKASELNEKLTSARKFGHEESVIRSLVKPTCLIIDEVARCIFDKENTRMFFDIVDRRYSKDCPNTMIFTSNLTPDKWRDYFTEEDSLLCALDRIFDNAKVFMIKGKTYRGRKRQTISIEVGDTGQKPGQESQNN